MSAPLSNRQTKRAQRKASQENIETAKPSSNWLALKESVAAKNPEYLRKAKRKRDSSPAASQSEEPEQSSSGPPTKLARKEHKSSFMDVLNPPEAGPSSHADAGRYIAIDCEFVGVGMNGIASSLARVSMVNFHGHILLDSFVRQKERVTDYRTWVSGVRAEDLRDAPTFEEVVQMVSDLAKGRILVGHAIWNDLQVLLLSHPRALIRDTQTYPGIHEIAKSKRPGLRNVAKLVLGIDIQGGEHSSVEDARATMAIFRAYKTEWEASLLAKTDERRLAAEAQAAKKAKPLPASTIDPTRRYRHNTSLGLAATLTSHSPDDPVKLNTDLQSETKMSEETIQRKVPTKEAPVAVVQSPQVKKPRRESAKPLLPQGVKPSKARAATDPTLRSVSKKNDLSTKNSSWWEEAF